MTHLPLDRAVVDEALAFLGCRRQRPSLGYLDALIGAFAHTVPWESVFRLIKRNATPLTADCPRWPQEVWRDAMDFGGGGTCFEIHYAFFALLAALGFDGYLTLNDMGEARACHAAVVIRLDGQKYLVDVSVPFPRALAFFPETTMRHGSPWLDFTIRPEGADRYAVERAPHARPAIFTLNDVPVAEATFAAAVEADYLPTGYFLNRVVINKLVNGVGWLFNSAIRPWMLEAFDQTGKHERPLHPETLAQTLAAFYTISAARVSAALQIVQAMEETREQEQADISVTAEGLSSNPTHRPIAPAVG